MKKINLLILAGVFLLLLSSGFLGYYLVNEDQIIEYSYTKSDIKLTRPEEKDWQLEISKLNLRAPIIINVDGNDEEAYMSALQNGVAHLAGSATPGSVGNIFIFGHSSYYFYDRGSYKYIFKDLNNLSEGDEVKIESNLGEYKYKVLNKKIVNPNEVQVVGEVIAGEETLSLMTCTPTGTALQRLIVVAERI